MPGTAIDKQQVEKAVRALFAWVQKNKDAEDKKDLFGDDEVGRGGHTDVDLVLTLKSVPQKQRNKPFRIPLPNTLYGLSGREICLIVKDGLDELTESLAANPVEGVSKVLPISTLRKHYRQYNDKRKLLTAYDLFLADERVVPLLPPLLGKKFFEKKKHPVPVNVTRKGFREELAAARDSTYFFQSAGACSLVKVAKTTFSVAHAVENILAAVQGAVQCVASGWKNIQAIHIKTSSSAALPVFTSLPTGHKLALPTVTAATGSTAAAAAAATNAAPAAMEDDSDDVDGDAAAPAPAAASAVKRKAAAANGAAAKPNTTAAAAAAAKPARALAAAGAGAGAAAKPKAKAALAKPAQLKASAASKSAAAVTAKLAAQKKSALAPAAAAKKPVAAAGRPAKAAGVAGAAAVKAKPAKARLAAPRAAAPRVAPNAIADDD